MKVGEASNQIHTVTVDEHGEPPGPYQHDLYMFHFRRLQQESLIFYPEILPPDYPFAFSEPSEEVTVPVETATLNALLFKAQNSKGVVFYLHGNAGSLRTWGAVAGDFTSRGYDILIPDYHGFGKSMRISRMKSNCVTTAWPSIAC